MKTKLLYKVDNTPSQEASRKVSSGKKVFESQGFVELSDSELEQVSGGQGQGQGKDKGKGKGKPDETLNLGGTGGAGAWTGW